FNAPRAAPPAPPGGGGGGRGGGGGPGGGPPPGRAPPPSRAERERSDARRVRSGKMGSNRSPDDYLALAERLERFLAELPG
ncbi:hypothetical protein QCC51_25475, partial [Pseudomonas aeruginosa]|nr:hypothetical protein [Pseudomonas aeruginosa]